MSAALKLMLPCCAKRFCVVFFKYNIRIYPYNWVNDR